jgi:hypothetical protein
MFVMPSYFTWLWIATAVPALARNTNPHHQSSVSPLEEPRVKIDQGVVVGKTQDGNYPVPVEAFMGLPYARPPIGGLRFRRAAPLPSSNSTILAQEYGSM